MWHNVVEFRSVSSEGSCQNVERKKEIAGVKPKANGDYVGRPE